MLFWLLKKSEDFCICDLNIDFSAHLDVSQQETFTVVCFGNCVGSGIENMFMIGSLSRTPGRMLMMRQVLSLYSWGRLHLQCGLCFVCLFKDYPLCQDKAANSIACSAASLCSPSGPSRPILFFVFREMACEEGWAALICVICLLLLALTRLFGLSSVITGIIRYWKGYSS